MYMTIGLIAFLSAGFFLIKGVIGIFRKKNFKKSFLISFASFIIFFTAAIMDPTPPAEVAKEGKLQNETAEKKEDQKAEDKNTAEKPKDEKAGQPEEQARKEAADEKAETEKSAEKAATNPTSSQKSTTPVAPKLTVRGVEAKVTKVVDGDTIEILMNGKTEKVRMLLLDTPETKHPSKPVEPFGPEASSFAKQTLEGKTVGIEAGLEERDRYGRLLAYVWIGSKTYQEMVLERGLGVTAYLYNDLKMLEQFHKAQNIARDKQIGVWSIPGYAHVDHNHGYHYEESQTTASSPAPKPATQPATQPATNTATQPAPSQPETFANCTELRKVYPDGVPSTHAAYQKKMDRDGDNYACEN